MLALSENFIRQEIKIKNKLTSAPVKHKRAAKGGLGEDLTTRFRKIAHIERRRAFRFTARFG
jgi:hypothetical protein